MVRVGAGNFTYDVIEGWGALPESVSFGHISDVSVDSYDRVYCFQRQAPSIVVLDDRGNYLKSWGDDPMAYAHGISLGSDASVYLTYRDEHLAIKCSEDGNLILSLGNKGVPSEATYEGDPATTVRAAVKVIKAGGPFNRPCKLVSSPSGDLYVADGYSNSRVHRFSEKGKLKMSWGQPGKVEPGQFHVPHSVFVDENGIVYVCYRENNRVQIFTQEGEFLAQWNQFGRPSGVFFDQHGRIYVADSESDNVQNPGWEMGIRIGEVETGWVTEFILYPWGDPRDVAGNCLLYTSDAADE